MVGIARFGETPESALARQIGMRTRLNRTETAVLLRTARCGNRFHAVSKAEPFLQQIASFFPSQTLVEIVNCNFVSKTPKIDFYSKESISYFAAFRIAATAGFGCLFLSKINGYSLCADVSQAVPESDTPHVVTLVTRPAPVLCGAA